MRLHGNTIVMVPYFDADMKKQYYRLTFTGDVDRKRIWRQVRRLYSDMGIKVPMRFMRKFATIIPQSDRNIISNTQLQASLEQWFAEMEAEVDAGVVETTDSTPSSEG